MRILILHNHYQHLGGEDIVVQQEADELKKRGYEVRILADKNKKGLKGFMQYGLYGFNIFSADKLSKEVKSFNPDVIHIHNLHYAIGPWIVRKLKKLNLPIVMTLHNFRLICPSATLFYNGKLHTESIHEDFPWTAVRQKALDNSFLKSFLTAFAYWFHRKIGTWNSINSYFTFSQFSKDIFVQSKLNIPANKFVIKPNFAPTPTIHSIEKESFKHFVYIGRLSVEKGIIPLLKATSETNHQLLIYGDGPLREQVEEYAKQFSNIEYRGFKPKEELQEELKRANALIVPSICYEGMPMGIIEAFALGTPVIGSNIGILNEMVTTLQTGLHFDPNKTSSIINGLNSWKELDSATKQQISQNCIDVYNKNYTSNSNIHILEEIYYNAIKENE